MRIGSGRKCFIRIIASISILCLMITFFAGCGEGNTANAKYRKINVIKRIFFN